MRFAMPRVRARLLLPLFAMLALPACVAAPVINTIPSACSGLVPDNWKEGVSGADLPEGNTVGDWVAFGDAQTAQLDKANGRTVDAITIIDRCEKRDAAAVKKARTKWLGIF